MFDSPEARLTERDIIRGFRVVQEDANRVENSREKASRAMNTITALELDTLLGHQFMINSALALARPPEESEDSRILFPTGLLFIAKLCEFAQCRYEDVPVDAIVAKFVKPELVTFEPINVLKATQIGQLELEVPLLAIDSCVYADAA